MFCTRATIRLAFLGQSCASSATALRAMLGGGATSAWSADRWSETLWPCGPPGDAGVASTGVGLAEGNEIVAVILAGSPRELPGEMERLAEAKIPVVWVRSTAEVTAALRAAAPDVAVAACFPWRLPRAAREAPRLGILNIHPSLLPVGRGPKPVFWTLRRGERTTGVTVHQMDGGFDTGPIVVQETMPVADGVRAPALENALMARGGQLLREALPAVVAGELQAAQQRPAGATQAPVPSAADWTMVTSLPAAWAWRFARGVAPLGGPLTVIAGGNAIPVVDALEWSPDERLPEAVIEEGGGTVRVRFSPGWVRFRHAVMES